MKKEYIAPEAESVNVKLYGSVLEGANVNDTSKIAETEFNNYGDGANFLSDFGEEDTWPDSFSAWDK